MKNPEMKRLMRGAWWGWLVYVLNVLAVATTLLLFLGTVLAVLNFVGEEVRGEAPGWMLGAVSSVLAISWLILLVIAIFNPDGFRRWVAEVGAQDRIRDRLKKFGAGGSAGFAGVIDEWAYQWTKGRILLGRSIKNGFLLGTDDDRGLLTIASSRSGKGVGVIIPNLLRWEGSAIVIDPKGTNAAVTMRKRREMGQAVHVVDPFGVVAGVASAAFNPLDVIDLKSKTLREDIGLIVDALIVPDGGHSAHWDETARVILAGYIAQLISTSATKPSLLDVRAELRRGAKDRNALVAQMRENQTPAALLTGAAASLLSSAGENERGAMMTTVMRNTAWLDSAAIAGVLERSSFRIVDVKKKPTTIFAVLPPHLLAEHSRFLRLFVNMTVRAASIGGKARVPVLLLLDEFYALGRLQSLEAASGALASYGLRLWPFLQNLTQLKQLYPENWQTFFANAGTVQLFAVNDLETAREISERLGQSAWTGTMNKRETRIVSNLLEKNEIEMLTSRYGDMQLILMAGEPPILARKLKYFEDRMFRGEWDQDPDFADRDEDDEDDQDEGVIVMN